MRVSNSKTPVTYKLPQLFILFNKYEHYQYSELELKYHTLKVYESNKVKRSYYNTVLNRIVMTLNQFIPKRFTRVLLKDKI